MGHATRTPTPPSTWSPGEFDQSLTNDSYWSAETCLLWRNRHERLVRRGASRITRILITTHGRYDSPRNLRASEPLGTTCPSSTRLLMPLFFGRSRLLVCLSPACIAFCSDPPRVSKFSGRSAMQAHIGAYCLDEHASALLIPRIRRQVHGQLSVLAPSTKSGIVPGSALPSQRRRPIRSSRAHRPLPS